MAGHLIDGSSEPDNRDWVFYVHQWLVPPITWQLQSWWHLIVPAVAHCFARNGTSLPWQWQINVSAVALAQCALL